MIKTKQGGYILIESLVGLVILSTVMISLIQVLPIMIEAKAQLDAEKTIYNTLYEIYDQQTFYEQDYPDNLTFYSPIPYTIAPNEAQLCAIYTWRDQHEKTICLSN